MTNTQFEVRSGVYYDSVILMQLQKALAALPQVVDAGVVMATAANKELLEANGYDLTNISAKADDLLIVVRGESEAIALDALNQVDALLKRRRSSGASSDFRPKSLTNAATMLPNADWVLVSVPGRYAAAVADEALDLGKHVFLYSDNVTIKDEIRLKQKAVENGLLLMGPDCGTAVINNIGLGFANVGSETGNIGVVAASGTGAQAVSVGIARRGGSLSQLIGTGGRDLKKEVHGLTAKQSLALLASDPNTAVVVLVSKPPAPAVAAQLLQGARAVGKPTVINFIGHAVPAKQIGNLHFARSLDEAAELAVQLASHPSKTVAVSDPISGDVRGLFSGGTLAIETYLALQPLLEGLTSNVAPTPAQQPADLWHSAGHTILDLGEDEFTQGRLHPMMDNTLRLQRLAQEAADPATGMILLDVVLGVGAHADPASELAPAITAVREKRPSLPILTLLVGNDSDPQNASEQASQLAAADAIVCHTVQELVETANGRLPLPPTSRTPPTLKAGFTAINVGLESFYESIMAQGGTAVHVDWRPPAGGNEKLMSILAKFKSKGKSG